MMEERDAPLRMLAQLRKLVLGLGIANLGSRNSVFRKYPMTNQFLVPFLSPLAIILGRRHFRLSQRLLEEKERC